ncbi:MAG TPA: trypsin-like peptidase domain-containing protein [Steroidobacteraceae bacterium]|jgi:S1-C subfamily serine protease
MKRQPLYSRATRTRSAAPARGSGSERNGSQPQQPDVYADLYEEQGPSGWVQAGGWLKRFYGRHDRVLLLAASVLIALAVVGAHAWLYPPARALTQHDIDGAVRYTIAHSPRGPADTTLAAATIAPDVVEVEGFLSPQHAAQLAAEEAKDSKSGHKPSPAVPQQGSSKAKPAPKATPAPLPDHPLANAHPDEPQPDAIGSGVVMDKSGKILTALHVVSGTDRWVVVFADGSQSDAALVGAQPQNDLAVLQPKQLPDELQPAALASTAGLRPGDQVVATGFPFGIGPSVSAGVVSGLKREFIDPDNPKIKLTNLIQFDAAVNPGNSGGPLVNRDGEVVGIVTAIVNPSGAHVFAGIGFAVPIENAARAIGDNPL